ncbi:MAG: CpsD/CapB family tyrosine-protein kinase [Phycisphaerae bacterium]
MGRIAEALKKAELERNRKIRSPQRIGMAGTLETDRADIDPNLSGFGDGRSDSPGASRPGWRASKRKSTIPARRDTHWEPLGPSPCWDAHPTVVAIHDRSSVITEQYRAARTWLLRRNSAAKAGGANRRGCVAVTSSIPREGKSVTTANLAVVMAEIRHMNVLAVDCDLRQGSLAKLLKMPNSPGLAEVLAGKADLNEAIMETPVGNLSFLPAGSSGDLNPAELLNSRTAAWVFDEIRERFHYVLVDTPPVKWLSDVGVIGALCSGIIMVVRMNKTASHLVRQSLHWLQANNLDVLGCIAADCRTKGARYEYEDIIDG